MRVVVQLAVRLRRQRLLQLRRQRRLQLRRMMRRQGQLRGLRRLGLRLRLRLWRRHLGRTVPEQRRFALRRPHALHRVKPQRHFGV